MWQSLSAFVIWVYSSKENKLLYVFPDLYSFSLFFGVLSFGMEILVGIYFSSYSNNIPSEFPFNLGNVYAMLCSQKKPPVQQAS